MPIERVLIHPFPNTSQWRQLCRVWRQWENLPTTRIIAPNDFKGLEDARYLNQVGKELMVGGQAGTECVQAHLWQLATDTRVKNGVVRVSVSQEATLIDPVSLQLILADILALEKVKIGITN